ncbi:hypothetical protein GCM10009860_08230 [Microbacterium mitrae]|uniref:Solute-binding protein family 5 domain-containing protein n=1 Tax=Microbacterium mitrae TaxID=664640 RepID=A0A5C8HQ91_9MICO|nr:ABC transporter substrate-binding protein [Microbacterium mitrae]TXK06174.1 hypothetical protein FVP60_04235 [Microbacterium mitrae]
MKKMYRAATVVAAFALALSVAGCAPNANSNSNSNGSSTGDNSSDQQSLTIAYSEGGKTLNPAEANDGTSDTLVLAAYDQLVTYGTKEQDGKQVSDTATIVPMIASEWTVDDTNTVYTFTIRDDITFHSGKQLTKTDVVRSFEHIADSSSASFLYGMAGISTVEEGEGDTVVITLTAPNHLFLQILPMYSFSMLDMDEVDKNGGVEWLSTHTAGSGAPAERAADGTRVAVSFGADGSRWRHVGARRP